MFPRHRSVRPYRHHREQITVQPSVSTPPSHLAVHISNGYGNGAANGWKLTLFSERRDFRDRQILTVMATVTESWKQSQIRAYYQKITKVSLVAVKFWRWRWRGKTSLVYWLLAISMFANVLKSSCRLLQLKFALHPIDGKFCLNQWCVISLFQPSHGALFHAPCSWN